MKTIHESAISSKWFFLNILVATVLSALISAPKAAAEDIIITVDTVDQSGQHISFGGFNDGLGTCCYSTPVTNTYAVGTGLYTYAWVNWLSSLPVDITLFKDTTYWITTDWIDGHISTVTRTQYSPGTTKVFFVFEMIYVIVDTVDQSGQHVDGGTNDGSLSNDLSTPATFTYANGSRPPFLCGYAGYLRPDPVNITIFKDTTYWIDVYTGKITKMESTPGINKVNFIFHFIDLILDTVNQSGQHFGGTVIWPTTGSWVPSPVTIACADQGTPGVGGWGLWLESPRVWVKIFQGTTYWVNANTGLITKTESTPGTTKVNFAFELIEVTLDTVNPSGQHIPGGVLYPNLPNYVPSPATFTCANGGRPCMSAHVGSPTFDWIWITVFKDTTYWVDGRTNKIIREDRTTGANEVHFAYSITVPAIIDVKPDTLNKASQSDKNAITAYIEIPGYDVNSIDVASVVMTSSKGQAAAQLIPTDVGDYDNDGVPDRMVKFDRQTIIAIVDIGEQVKITINGGIAGSVFQGSDEIRVIGSSKK